MTYTCDYCQVTLKSKGSHEKSSKHLNNVKRLQEIEEKGDQKENQENKPKTYKLKLPLHMIAQNVLPFLRLHEQISLIHLFDMSNDEMSKDAYNRVTRNFISDNSSCKKVVDDCDIIDDIDDEVEIKPSCFRDIERVLSAYLPLMPADDKIYNETNLYDLFYMNNIIIRKFMQLYGDGQIVKNKRSTQGCYKFHPIIDHQKIQGYDSYSALNRLIMNNEDQLFMIRNIVGLKHRGAKFTLCFDDFEPFLYGS